MKRRDLKKRTGYVLMSAQKMLLACGTICMIFYFSVIVDAQNPTQSGNSEQSQWWPYVLAVIIGLLGYGIAEIRARKSAVQVATKVQADTSAELHARIAEKLHAVNAVGHIVTAAVHGTTDAVLEKIGEQTRQLIYTQTMFIALYDNISKRLTFPVATEAGKPQKYVSRIIQVEDSTQGGLTEEVLRTRQPLNPANVEDFYKRGQFEPIQPIPKSWLGVPILLEHEAIGVIALLDDHKPNAYSAEDAEILQIMAAQTAIAIANARIEEKNRQLETATRRIADAEAALNKIVFAADFAHRMNNLAGTIPVWINMIQDEFKRQPVQDSKVTTYLNQIDHDIRVLLDTAAAEVRKNREQEKSNDVIALLHNLLRQVQLQYSRYLDTKQLRIEDDIWPELHKVYGMPSSLSAAIFNIITNGIEAITLSEQPGSLIVSAHNYKDENEAEWVKIEIRDTGKGIPPGDHEKIFSSFFTTKATGTGYGLWRAKNVIENIGGMISFTSSEKEGTTFTVLLPKSTYKNEPPVNQ